MNPDVMRPGNVKTGNGGAAVPYYVDPSAQHGGSATAKIILYAVFKRKWQVLGIIAVVVLSILVTGLLRPRIYQSSAKVMVRPARAEIQVSAGDDQREIMLPVSASAEMINSEIEILRSSELMRQVLVRTEEEGRPIFGADTTMPITDQIGALKGLLSVSAAPQSNVIILELYARDAEKGREILDTLTAVYLERHAQVHGNAGAAKFFSSAKDGLRGRVEQAESALADFVAREGLVVPEEQILWALTDSVKYRDVLRMQSNKIAALERDLAMWRQQIKSLPKTVSVQVERVNPMSLPLGIELGKREAKRAELLQSYTEHDRRVMDVDAEIALLKARIGEGGSASVVASEHVSPNPARQRMADLILKGERNLYDLRARVAALPAWLDQIERESTARAVDLRQKAIHLASLDQEVQAARETYRLYEKKEEEARISEALDKEGLVNVSVLDTPTVPTKPFNRMNPLMLVAALVAGTGLGIGAAVGLEMINRNFKLEEQVEHYLELPVFAVIPDLSEVVGQSGT